MRIAQIIDTRTEDPDLKDKIKQVMDATRKTEDEVCTALHDCDNDLDRAVNMLLEGMGQVCTQTLLTWFKVDFSEQVYVAVTC